MGVAVALGDNIENAISKAKDVATSITCEMWIEATPYKLSF